MKREEFVIGGGLAPIDICTIAYVLISQIILLAHFRSHVSYMLLAALLCVAIVALMAPRVRRSGRVGAFAGEFYPVLLTIALYTEVGLTNQARGISYDTMVQSWEQTVFGGQPSLHWMTAWPHPFISSVLHLSYLSYYLIVLGVPLVIWFSGRHEAAREAILAMMVTFYISYTIFRFFPVAGPRFVFSLPDSSALQTPVAAFAHKLVAGGSAWGTAFPSSHVAVAFVNAGSAWRIRRRSGVIVFGAAVLLALGTVYGQFHYAIDAATGAILGILILVVRSKVVKAVAPPYLC